MMKRATTRAIVTLAAVLFGAAPAAGDAIENSIRQLERAVRPQRSGEHLNLLFALRQLHCPALRPLFYELVQHREWPVQVHAVLGLAELSENKRIDPWMVRQITAVGHEAIVANALDLDLLDVEQMRELLRDQDVGAMTRLLLLAELVSEDQELPAGQLEKLSDHGDLHIAALAAALMMQRGDASKFSAVRDRLSAVHDRERNNQLQWLFEGIRQYELTAMLPWVKETLQQQDIDESVQFAAVFALAALGDADVMSHWERCLGPQPRHAQQIRYGLMLLVCADKLPRGAFDALPDTDALLAQIAVTGRALQSGDNVVAALIDLLKLEHRKSTDLAMDHVKKLPVEQATQVYAHLIDRLADQGDKPLTAERIAVAVHASGELVKINPEAALTRLSRAEDDSVHQQAILLGLMEDHGEAIGKAAGQVRRIGAGRADSLALLLMAKNLPALDQEQIVQLGMIASGGGRVSDVLQTQAAWLYLRHTGNIEKALSRLFPGS